MQDATINFSFSGLPANYCFTDFNRFALDIVAGMSGFLPGTFSSFVVSATEPDVADRDKVWIQVDANGIPTGKIFRYFGGWYMQNPRRDPNERVWWAGSEAAAWSYDGGDGTDPSTTPPTPYSGAMWEVDHDYDFRFPIGAGTSATPTTIAPGATGGDENSTLPDHTHLVGRFSDNAQDDPFFILGSGTNASSLKGCFGNLNSDIRELFSALTGPIMQTDVVNSATPITFTNMPPYRVGYWLKPTARQYYTP